MNNRKSKWFVLVLFLITSTCVAFWLTKNNKSHIDTYKFAETYADSTADLQTIDRAGLPFKFLFANAVKSPFSFNANLGRHHVTGGRALWIFASQADNHGKVAIRYEGKLIGTVNNQLTTKRLSPIPKLSYVGELTIASGDLVLNVMGFNHNLDHHYSELGLLVLAPKGLSKEKILSELDVSGSGIYSGFKKVVSEIKEIPSKILPNREQVDIVPERLKLNSGTFHTDIYRLDQAAKFSKVSENIFSGKMADFQRMPSGKSIMIISLLLILILISLVLDIIFSACWTTSLSLIAISALSIFLSIRASEGWDEFFINLRHAYMLLHHGVYSINAHSMIEASVDFIPILLTAALGLLSINLIDAFIVVSLLGNILVIVFSYFLARKLTENRTWALFVAFLIGIYSNVVSVGGTGFSAVLFSGWILASSYFILFSGRKYIGMLLLSSLTLIRTEGILFAVLLIAYIDVVEPCAYTIRTKEWGVLIRRGLLDLFVVSIPFFLSIFVRHVVFGHSIPNPILFKNTNLDSSYFNAGIDRFIQMVSNNRLHLMVALIVLLLVVIFKSWRDNKIDIWMLSIRKLIALNCIIFLFILPYYIGGGDWFPVGWNRYGMPFNLILTITFMVLIYGVFFKGIKRFVTATTASIFCLFLYIGYLGSAQFLHENYNFRLPRILQPAEGRWQRIDNLASLGQFLNNILPLGSVVSSPEEATIMYFSERDMLGLLGVSNPDIVSMPLQPIVPGDLMHRRRGYNSIYISRPDVIALWEPVVVGTFFNQPDLKVKIHKALQNDMFNSTMVDTAYYRVGSFKALEKMGYKHISVSYNDRIFSLFISSKIYDIFIKNMLSQGFIFFGADSINYSVNPDLSKKYLPASMGLLNEL